MNEYMYNVFDSRPDCKVVSIWDVTGAGPYDLVGNARKLMAAIMKCMKDHYPARSEMLFIINAPQWFTAMWTVIKTMADPAVLDKIQILGADYTTELFKWVAPSNVPTEFGGEDLTPIGESDEEIALRKAADQLNGGPGASYAVSLAARTDAGAKEPMNEDDETFDILSTLSWLETPADKGEAFTKKQIPLQSSHAISGLQTTVASKETSTLPCNPLPVNTSHVLEETPLADSSADDVPPAPLTLFTSPPPFPAPPVPAPTINHPEGSRPDSLAPSDLSRFEDEPPPKNFVEMVSLWATTAASAFREAVDSSAEPQLAGTISASPLITPPTLPAPVLSVSDEVPQAPSLADIIQPLIAFRDNFVGAAGALTHDPEVKDSAEIEPTWAPLALGTHFQLFWAPLLQDTAENEGKSEADAEARDVKPSEEASELTPSENSTSPSISPQPLANSPEGPQPTKPVSPQPACTISVNVGSEEQASGLSPDVIADAKQPCEVEGTRKKAPLKRILSKSKSPLQWRNKKAPIPERGTLSNE